MKEARETNDYGNLMAQFIENQYEQERVADLADFQNVTSESPVIIESEVVFRKGDWIVYLIYIDLADTNSFVRRAVKVCKTRKLAEITGAYLRRAHSMDTMLTFGLGMDEWEDRLN